MSSVRNLDRFNLVTFMWAFCFRSPRLQGHASKTNFEYTIRELPPQNGDGEDGTKNGESEEACSRSDAEGCSNPYTRGGNELTPTASAFTIDSTATEKANTRGYGSTHPRRVASEAMKRRKTENGGTEADKTEGANTCVRGSSSAFDTDDSTAGYGDTHAGHHFRFGGRGDSRTRERGREGAGDWGGRGAGRDGDGGRHGVQEDCGG